MKKNLFIKFFIASVTCLLLISSVQAIFIIDNTNENFNYQDEKLSSNSYKDNHHRLFIERTHNDFLDNIRASEIVKPLSSQKFLIDGNHLPIYIDGNDDFTSDNGVTGGSGIINDPYVIEDWVIINDGSPQNGIFIINTDAYFVIRNCSTNGFKGKFYSGIRFDNVKNGKIIGVDSFNNYNSIDLRSCTDIVIDDCMLHDNYGAYASGVDCYRCSNINIKSCEIYMIDDLLVWGVEFFETNNCVIEDCVIFNTYFSGVDVFTDDKSYPNEHIIIKNCKIYNDYDDELYSYGISFGTHYKSFKISEKGGYNTISNCEIYNSYIGVEIANVPYCTVENCDIYNNNESGIEVTSSYCSIRNNKIYGNAVGISIWGAIIFGEFGIGNLVEFCDIYGNGIGLEIMTAFPVKIFYNNINNNYGGIFVDAFGFGSSKINHNNIFGNYYNFNGTIENIGLYNIKVFTDARENWWGSEKGPSTMLFKNRGDTVINLLGFVLYRPWEIEPVVNAGVQEGF